VVEIKNKSYYSRHILTLSVCLYYINLIDIYKKERKEKGCCYYNLIILSFL